MRSYTYASMPDVESLLSGVNFGATSAKPNATQVANFLNLASDDLDSLLANVDYVTPIPTAASAGMEMMRGWTAIGAAYRAAMAMPQGRESKHAETYGAEWSAILTSIEGGKRFLPDVPRLSSKLPRSSGPEGPPVFTRENSQTLR